MKDSYYHTIVVHKEEICVCDWPTDSVYIHCNLPVDQYIRRSIHTSNTKPKYSIFFIPGNPGCIGWYIQLLSNIIAKLGPEYVAHGVSYAGHGISSHQLIGCPKNDSCSNRSTAKESNREFPWRLKNQIDHKIDFVDQVRTKYSYDDDVKFIFVSHSIGSHIVQRLNILRPDILSRTSKIINLMPFIRFDPSLTISQKLPLSFLAHLPGSITVGLLRLASSYATNLSIDTLDHSLNNFSGVKCIDGRILAIELVRQPEMASNFLSLGIEELRSLPTEFDSSAFKVICEKCPIYMLYCGGPDQWAPITHMLEIAEKQKTGSYPKNIHLQYQDDLIHGFVVIPEMIAPVTTFIIDACLQNNKEENGEIKIKLNSSI